MKLVAAYLPLLLWAAAVLTIGTLQLGVGVPSGWDKAAHFVMYGVGGGIAAWTGHQRGAREGWIALAFVLLTGAADELHQSTLATRNADMLATRNADILDWVADVAGAVLAYGALARLLRRRR